MYRFTITYWVLAAALIVMEGGGMHAQNTIIATPITTTNPSFTWDATVFSDRVPAFALGHQWGTSALDKANSALSMNVTSDHYGDMWDGANGIDLDSNGLLSGFLNQLYHLGDGYLDTNYVFWGSPMVWTPSHIDFYGYWMGMRWEPSENAGLDRTWTPRDAEAWPFSFGSKHHGTIPASPSDANYRRFVLAMDSMLAYPVKVLDSVEPRNQLFMRGVNVRWERDPLDTMIVSAEDSTNCRRLQLVVNLRRVDALDTVVDDSVVVSIVVPYQLRWKSQYPLADDYQPFTFRMPFDSVPRTTLSDTMHLPLGRGTEMKMRPAPGGYMDSILVTRRMLPLHSDPGGPDITLVAEFRTDTIIEIDNERRPHILKTDKYGFVPSGKATTSQADSNKRYLAIDSLGVTIWHHGTSSSVAIRSASLVTPQTKRATSGYWDAAWAAELKTTVDSIKKIRDIVEDSTGRHLKVLGFYLADEFDVEHLLGMRYRLEFLDRRVTSETGFGGARSHGDNFLTAYGLHKLHGFPTKFLWTSGMGHPSRQTTAPYFGANTPSDNEYGCSTCPGQPAPTMGLKIGYRRGDLHPPYRSHETRIGTPYFTGGSYANVDLPLPTAPNNYAADSVYESIMHSDLADVGLMAMAEITLYENMYQTGQWYFQKRRNWWSNHFYHLDLEFYMDASTAGRPFVRHNKFQPLTGETVRLQHGMALNLGCRGFMYDKWRDNWKPPIDASELDASDRIALRGKRVFPSVDPSVTTITADTTGAYFPGYLTEDSTALAWDKNPAVSVDSLFSSLHIGGDYLTVNDAYKVDSWVSLDTLAKYMQVSRCMPGDSSANIYVGRKSVQMETRWWHDLVTDTSRYFKFGTKDSSNAYYFMRTRPVGWFGKGYKTLTNGNLTRLRQWVDAYADSLKVQRWTRKSPTDTALVYEWEPLGEQLYDVVLMDISESDTATDADTCLIAVTNRRSSPHLFNASLADSVEFMSSYDFDTLTRGSRPDLRYQQVGARRITIPFNYKVDASRPYLLHVRELRPAYDSQYTIDTVLNWNSDLIADFRPGETRYFKVNRLPAIDTLDNGYIAYSTQNKMIVYPVRKGSGSGYGDSVRYHMVYHRRDTDPLRSGPWTVFYQRSRPYHKDSLHMVANLIWDAPLRLSKITTASTPSTDGQNRTRYGSIDSNAYEASVPDTAHEQRDCCCGFPSIVIREIAADTPKVFVVYACEDMWAPVGVRNDYFHIVENSFLDQVSLNPAALEVNGKSLVVTSKDIGHDVPADVTPPIEDYAADTLGSLAKYGTPVINASAENHMYYAWSSSGSGIGAGTKLGNQDWFPSQTALVQIPTPTITWYYNHDDIVDTIDIAGGTALYPSLNVYSNLSHNQTTATLVWEEGAYNRHIRYTRLKPGIGTAISRELPAFVDMSYDSGTPPSIAVDHGNAIAIVGGASTNEEAELPVVVRSLQVDTMSMFINDGDGNPSGLFKYNHESVAWGEYLISELRTRVRYNHFVDMSGHGPNELHYWWANTTGGTGGSSVFHPVLTNGTVRLDSLTWEGVVDDSLITYDDSLHIVRGNLSDSALIVNYSFMNSGSYSGLRTRKTSGYASYWTGLGQFSALLGQQINIRRMPPPPAPPTVTYHYAFLRADGAWPHVAMRQRENLPGGINSVRRILQYTGADAPSLLASAEQFYKVYAEGDQAEPASYGGFEIGGSKVTARGAFEDGRSIGFQPVYDQAIPEGFVGNSAYAWQMAAMSRPVSELVSEVFTVGDVLEMKLLSTGLLRTDIDLTIEEVDPLTVGIGAGGEPYYTSLEEPESNISMTLAEPDEEEPDQVDRETYFLTDGQDKLYRLRLKYTGTNGIVYREDLDIDPEEESFGKPGVGPLHVVNLSSRRSVDLNTTNALSIYPNPSAGAVTIIVGGGSLTANDARNGTLLLDIADVMGNIVLSSQVALGEAFEVRGLPVGYYAVRIRSDGSIEDNIKASGRFAVIR